MKNPRLNELLNANRATHVKPLWEASLERALGESLKPEDFLDIACTLELKARFLRRVKSRRDVSHLFFSQSEFEKGKKLLESIGHRKDLERLILFSSVDKLVGAVKVNANSLFGNIEGVWEVVGEDLSTTTPNLEDGFCLERNYYDESGHFQKAGIFELTAWGRLQP